MNSSQVARRDHIVLEPLGIAVVWNAWILHRRIDDDLDRNPRAAIWTSGGDVRAGQRDHALLLAQWAEPDVKKPLRIDEDLVGSHAAIS
jgi:hypothetical protein